MIFEKMHIDICSGILTRPVLDMRDVVPGYLIAYRIDCLLEEVATSTCSAVRDECQGSRIVSSLKVNNMRRAAPGCLHQ